MFGWFGILAGLGSWAKESYDRNHVNRDLNGHIVD